MMHTPTLIVFDIGGTNTRVARVQEGVIEHIEKAPTPNTPEEGVVLLGALARKACRQGHITSLVGGCAGIITPQGVLFRAPHLPEWNNAPIQKMIEKEFGVPVTIKNDSMLGALGEMHRGGGVGATIGVYVTVSTGIGGARIVQGNIDSATYGFEIGHQLINGVPLEMQASGTALRECFGAEPGVFAHTETLRTMADILGDGLYNTILHWSPDTIVLGGPMIVGKNSIPLSRIIERITNRLTLFPTIPHIVPGTLGDTATLEGAIVLHQQQLQ